MSEQQKRDHDEDEVELSVRVSRGLGADLRDIAGVQGRSVKSLIRGALARHVRQIKQRDATSLDLCDGDDTSDTDFLRVYIHLPRKIFNAVRSIAEQDNRGAGQVMRRAIEQQVRRRSLGMSPGRDASVLAARPDGFGKLVAALR